MNASVTGASSAMEYLEIMPRPKQMPARHQAPAALADQRPFEIVERGGPCRSQRRVGSHEESRQEEERQ